MKGKRNSNIELLRIFCMVLIVLYHFHAREYNLYVVQEPRPEDTDFLWKLILHSIGKLGVPIFVFISGWFGIKFRNDRLWDLLIQCGFYAFLSAGLASLLYHHFVVKDFIFFLNHWWFMAAYIVLYCLSPGINMMFEKCSKSYMLVLILLLYFISFGDILIQSAKIGGLYIMFTMYLSARWLKLYAEDWILKYGALLLLGGGLIRFGIIIGGYYTAHMNWNNYVQSYVSPLTTIIAAGIFVMFSKIQFNSVIVNRVAASSLSVYLLSESSFGILFFKPFFPKEYNLLHYITAAVAVYLCITVVDQVRKLITDHLIMKRLK